MRSISALLACLLFCGTVTARPRHWYTDWKFYAGEAVIIGAVAADARSTCLGFERGLVEGNPIFRGNHSCDQTKVLLGIGGAAYTGLHIWMTREIEDEQSKPWRVYGRVALPVIACAWHCTSAIRNYSKLPAR